MLIDLHVHSTLSDGTLTPEQLFDRANELGLDYMAISDHDSLESSLLTIVSKKTKFIPGCELSTISKLTGKKFHLLGFFPRTDFESQEFCKFRDHLDEMRAARIRRSEKIIDLLNSEFGLELDFVEFCKFMRVNLQTNTSENAIGRPHVADYLVFKQVVGSRRQAFDEYLNDNSPAYVPTQEYYLEDAIHDIKNVGGFAFIAHAMQFENNRLEEDVANAFEHGLDGLEVYHSANENKYDYLLHLTDYYTIGSDWHSEETKWPLGCSFGNKLMPESDKEKLMKLFFE